MYVVYELQTWQDGTMHTIEVPDKGHDPAKTDEQNQNEALSEWHNILKYAAISELPCHGAVVLRNDGLQIAAQCYKHVHEENGK